MIAFEKTARRGCTHPLSARRVPIMMQISARSGSTQSMEPEEPVCPNVRGDVSDPLLWRALPPFTSHPMPQLDASQVRVTPVPQFAAS